MVDFYWVLVSISAMCVCWGVTISTILLRRCRRRRPPDGTATRPLLLITNDGHSIRVGSGRSLGGSRDHRAVVASYEPGRPSCSSSLRDRRRPRDLRGG